MGCTSTRIAVRKGPDGEMQLAREELPPLPPELQTIIDENR